jgi:hypothetical protein
MSIVSSEPSACHHEENRNPRIYSQSVEVRPGLPPATFFNLPPTSAMSSKRAPAFPVPVTNSSRVDDLVNKMQGLGFNPPPHPPPNWTGGFNLPLSTLSKYDPYLSQNKPSKPVAKRPQPNTPPSSYIPPNRRSSPTEANAAPAMPVPSPYLPSSSDPSLPFINMSTKPTRRRSNPTPQPPAPPSPAGK